MASICKIPPTLPLPKGGITPLWQRGATTLREAASAKAGGRFSDAYVNSILRTLATQGFVKIPSPQIPIILIPLKCSLIGSPKCHRQS